MWHWAWLSSVCWWSGAHSRAVSVSVRFVCALMQSDLVIASDRNFNLTAGIAEEVLRIVVGQIAGIVLVNFGNNIATQKFLLCRTVHLDPGNDQRSVEICSTNQPNSPRNLRRITRQCNQELVWFRTHDLAWHSSFLPDSQGQRLRCRIFTSTLYNC